MGINMILNIVAILVAFVAFIAFADEVLKWATALVGLENVGIQFVVGKIFIPLSWSLGVAWKDCEAVGNIIGTKTFINEFVAYRLLGEYKKAGEISVSRLLLCFTVVLISIKYFNRFDLQLLRLMRFVASLIPGLSKFLPFSCTIF